MISVVAVCFPLAQIAASLSLLTSKYLSALAKIEMCTSVVPV